MTNTIPISNNQILILEKDSRYKALGLITEEMTSIENKFRAGTYTEQDETVYENLDIAWTGLYTQIYEA